MGRITEPRRSYGHRVYSGPFYDTWKIAWTIDRKVAVRPVSFDWEEVRDGR